MGWNRSSGWNGERDAKGRGCGAAASKRTLRNRLVFAILLAASIFVGAYFVFVGDEAAEVEKPAAPAARHAEIPKAKPAAPPKAIAMDKAKAADEEAQPSIVKIDGRIVNRDLRKAFVSTNPPTMRGPVDRYRKAIEEGRRPLFKNACDLVLSQYAIPGEISPPPPVTPDLKNAFVMSSLEKIEITDEDSPRDREIKEGVIALRAELHNWLRDGGEFDAFMARLQARQEQESFYVSEVASNVEKEFRETGDIESTLRLWRSYNERLVNDGLRRTPLPKAVRVHFLKNKMEVPAE